MKFEGPPGFQIEAPAAVSVPPPAMAGRPRGRRLWAGRAPWLFIAIVVAPTLLVTLYYLFVAAPLYVSEARFVVRSRNQTQPAALGSLLQGVGVALAPGETDAYEVHEYMVSRDAAHDLTHAHDLRELLARPEADVLARFPRPFEGQSFENLYRSYRRFVTVGYDSQTGISTLRVEAFRPGDARDIAAALLDGGEALVNRLNDRAAADAVAQAQRQVLEAETHAVEAEGNLTAFRNAERLIDPQRSSISGIDLLGKLEAQLASMRAERAGLAASAPESPQLPVLDRRIAAFAAQLESERTRIAGEADSLAPKVGEYERLTLARDLAVKSVETAVGALEAARLEARRKQLYLERVVSPDLPDKAERPQRLLTILKVLVTTLLAYAIVSLVVAGLREHRQL
jgi:BexC/CtrB/KpsE family polysaccharide export inner-membrane protein